MTFIISGISFILLLLYIVILIYLGSGLNRIKHQNRSEETPFVSVIVCAHNEESNLPVCLELLSNQNYPDHLTEIILVNDRSTDQTKEIIEKKCSSDKRFTCIHIYDKIEEFAPKKRAIDTAIRQSKGDIILLTDADGRPAQEWIRTMVSYYTNETDMVIGYAPYRVKPERHISKQILSLEYLSHAVIAAASTGIGYPLTCVGTNMSYRKSVYFEVEGFGEFKSHLSGDDDLFLTRVREFKKYKIGYAADAGSHVYNNPPRLWRKFIHQRLRYASKGFDYPRKVTFGLILYFLFNLFLFTGLISFVFSTSFFIASVAIFLLKAIAEFSVMQKGAEVLNDKRYLKLFPIAAFLHIPYVLIFAILGQMKLYKWAGNSAKTENKYNNSMTIKND